MAPQVLPTLSLLALASADSDFSPAFFWSPRDIGVGQSAQHLHEASSHDLEGALSAISGRGKHHFVHPGKHESPEVQLVFLADDLTTERVRSHAERMSNLDSLLKSSTSSLSVPFTTRSPSSPRLFDAAMRVHHSKAEDFLSEHQNFFNDGVPNMVVVELEKAAGAPDLAANDDVIGRLSRLVNERTEGKYMGMLTGMQNTAEGNLPAASRGRLLAASTKSGPEYLHMTPTLLTAYLIMFLLFVIFLNGFCCLFSLQTPRAFPKPKKDDE